MPNENANARAALKLLENDPKHTKPTPEGEAQTRNDDLDDPKHQKKDAKIDARWHQDSDGNWTHPDFE